MPKRLILISPFPPKGTTYENKYSALASFAKNKVEALIQNDPDLKILVLADDFPKSCSWKDKNLEVRRIWRRNSFLVYIKLIKEIFKEKKTRDILIELEWALFGSNPFLIGLMPLFILVLRVFGKKVFVVSHGVSLNFFSLAPQLGIKRKSLKAMAFNLFIKTFYLFLVSFSSKIIVLEQHFATLINQKFKTKKAIFIPHGIYPLSIIPNIKAKEVINLQDDDFVITNFGFLSWYKGSDLLVDFFKKFLVNYPNEKIILLFAGGESLVHKNNPVYKRFVNKIMKTAKENKKIIVTGFIPEKELPLYLNATDLFVFPYRQFISSSGPLSFAFTLEKPVLFSTSLADYFESEDLKVALTEVGLTIREITFALNEKGFSKALIRAKNKNNLKKLKEFSKLMKERRDWSKVGWMYLKALEE